MSGRELVLTAQDRDRIDRATRHLTKLLPAIEETVVELRGVIDSYERWEAMGDAEREAFRASSGLGKLFDAADALTEPIRYLSRERVDFPYADEEVAS